MYAMSELIFEVRESPEGGFEAKGLGAAIFTEADDLAQLKEKVVDVVKRHFDPGSEPKSIRLLIIREEVIAA